MKKIFIILSALVILSIFALALHSGLLVPDHSGERQGDCLYWNDARYVCCDGAYSEGKTIARTSDGWQINEVRGDETRTFVVLRSFLDQYLMVRDDYAIPAGGEITCAVWRHETITDAAFLSALSALLADIDAGICPEAGDLSDLSEEYQNYSIMLAFEGCPIATNFAGCLWQAEDRWYFAPYSPLTASCYQVPDAFAALLARYN